MAVFALLLPSPVFFVFVALLALRINMLPYKRELGLGIVIKIVFFPVLSVMALLTGITKLVFVYVILFVAIYALCG